MPKFIVIKVENLIYHNIYYLPMEILGMKNLGLL